MFKNLLEVIDPSQIRLSNTQKAVLVSIYSAQTPELAYEAATGSEAITSAKDFLLRHLLIREGNGQLATTSEGLEVLENNGLVDETGEITENGKKLIEALNVHRQEFMESLIPYRTIKSLQ